MFSDKEFFQVNREERNYGFLLISSLIYENNFRIEFLKIIKNNSPILSEKIQPTDSIDVYAEVALFRDYWFQFGYHKNYTSELHQSRLTAILKILDIFQIDTRIIGKYKIFWTGKIGESKLWYPGKWNISEIQEIQKQEKISDDKLLRIRWALNAKPDILIKSENWAVFIELKIESGIGENQDGYNQEKTQQDIIEIAKKTIPSFFDISIDRLVISQKKQNSIKWDEFTDFIENDIVKKYMKHIPK